MRNPKLYVVAGGAAFALTWTVVNYLYRGELTWLGLVGGIAWFVTSLAIGRWGSNRPG